MTWFFITYLLYSLHVNLTFYLIYILLVGLYTYITQFVILKTPFNHMRNKVTVASWNSPCDPQFYGQIKIDVSKIEPYLEKISKETGKKFTFTLFSIKLISILINKFPSLNTYIKYGLINSKAAVDLCCLVTIGEGVDLANTVVCNSEKKSLSEIYNELQESVDKLRKKKNEVHNKKNKIGTTIPSFLLAPLVQITSYLSSIGVGIKELGMRPFEFGSCVITSIGSIGISDAFVPIPPPSFCPLLISICKKETKYVYDKDGKINESKTLGFSVTADYRFVDTMTLQGFISEMKRIGENPEIFEEEMKKASS